ncbi:muscarinic acetylcholine receptor M5-like [Strongylocentrotus purpuratus]|uniref:G-protein coupled receptors family 1 profile domain-containing protein n=1 Tax=Strongylocentrotus purpuratus TaxID=7668 RepID=A0A7M7RHH7_STRPU|nr:muscarinic acetylcholine receptor M5-like [Strongylocentrotus purpuratus]|eukprot:XP_789360.1 PREDICTED: muscarinic acetylcholine receptor M5-like [Strongylocentrotus purpuratus]
MKNLSVSVEPYTSFFDDASDDNFATTVETIVDGSGGSTRYKSIDNLQGLILGTSLVILIIVTNLISLGAFAVEKRLRTYNNYFIINLALSDLVLGILQIVGVIHTFTGYFPGSPEFCKVYLGLRYSMFSVSVVGVVIICIDRHRATYDPINHYMTKSKRKAVILNILPWVISFSFWMFYTTVWDFIVDSNSTKSCLASFARYPVANMFQTALTFFLPLAVISVLYLRIYIKIKETVGGRSINKQFGEHGGGEMSKSTSLTTVSSDLSSSGTVEMKESSAQVKTNGDTSGKGGKVEADSNRPATANRESTNEMQKATRTLSYIVFSFAITWLPNSIIYFLYAIDPELIAYEKLPRDLKQFFVWVQYANSFFNPICYLVSQPLFRKTIVNMLCRPRRYC